MRIEEYDGPSGAMKDSLWLASEDLLAAEGDVEAIIESVLYAEGVELNGGRKENKFVIQFKGKQKRLILNNTNRKMLVRLYGAQTANWKGKPVTMYVDHNVKFAGKKTDGIRFRNTGPTESENLAEKL